MRTTFDVKKGIEAQKGHPARQQRLIFKGMPLSDDWALATYGIKSGDTVHLVKALQGGGGPELIPAPMVALSDYQRVAKLIVYMATQYLDLHKCSRRHELAASASSIWIYSARRATEAETRAARVQAESLRATHYERRQLDFDISRAEANMPQEIRSTYQHLEHSTGFLQNVENTLQQAARELDIYVSGVAPNEEAIEMRLAEHRDDMRAYGIELEDGSEALVPHEALAH